MRVALKRVALLISIILVSPFIILTKLGFMLKSEVFFTFSAQAISIVPGLVGNYFRLGYYKLILTKVSSDATIGFGTCFSRKEAQIGKNAGIGSFCIVGKVKLDDQVLVASRVSLMSGKYQHGSALVEIPSPDGRFESISIGQRTWIGEGAIVAANVGSDCIVAAGSVVMREVPSGCLAIGNPAKFIKIDRERRANSTEVGSPV